MRRVGRRSKTPRLWGPFESLHPSRTPLGSGWRRQSTSASIGYLDRLQDAGVPDEKVDEALRLMSEFAWSKLHADTRREKSVEDQLIDIDASWKAIQESIESRGGPKL